MDPLLDLYGSPAKESNGFTAHIQAQGIKFNRRSL